MGTMRLDKSKPTQTNVEEQAGGYDLDFIILLGLSISDLSLLPTYCFALFEFELLLLVAG